MKKRAVRGGKGGRAGAPATRKQPKVCFVGMGPGDPELITVRGAKTLKDADVVVYAGSLIDAGALRYCRKDARLYNSASMDLEAIMKVMVDAARVGMRVVRLHSGDPSLYSALGEQAAILEREGIGYAVIPGVSSAFAAAASLGRELTIPEATQTVIFTRFAGRTAVPDNERLSSLSAHRATICVFLSVSMIDSVVRELLENYPPRTPAAVVYRASWKDERVIMGTLKDIAGKTKKSGITRQALIMVGEALGDGIGAGKKSRLYDRDFSHSFRRS